MNEKRFYNAHDISDFMSVSIPMAYKIIRKLNDELSINGYITVAGRVSKDFFEERVYVSSNKQGVKI